MKTDWIVGKYLTIKAYFVGDGTEENPFVPECSLYYPEAFWYVWSGHLRPGIKNATIVYLDLDKTPEETARNIIREKKGVVSILGKTDRVPCYVKEN